MNNIGLKIRKLRELKGYSREQMANSLGMSERGYGKIENGENKEIISLEKLNRIAEVLEIDPIDLLNFDESFVFNNCNQNTSLINNGTINSSEFDKEDLIATLIPLIEKLLEKLRK